MTEGEPTNSITLTKRHFEELLQGFSCFADINGVLEKPAAKRIALSFDDGYDNLYTVAYPLLKEKGVPFTVFIAPSFIGKAGYLTKDQLLELAQDPLVTVGSHGLTHLALKGQSAEIQERELMESKARLEDLTGAPVDLLAYPNGQADDTTFAVLQQKNAYRYAFLAAGGGISTFSREHFAMPRLRMDEKAWAASYEMLRFAYGAN